jgi:hypothetical protein
MKTTEEYFESNKFKYTTPIKLIKDLADSKWIFDIYFVIYDYNLDYTFYRKYPSIIIWRTITRIDNFNNFLLNLHLTTKEYFFIKELTFNHFIFFKVVGRWIQFVKKRKRQRICLKLLEATARHLGNPRFINFNL